jgi:hypothetical protein
MDHFLYQSHTIKALAFFSVEDRYCGYCANISRKCREEGTIEKFFLSDFCISAKILQRSKTETTFCNVRSLIKLISVDTNLPECFRDLAGDTGHTRISELMRKRKRALRKTRDGKYSRETLLLSCPSEEGRTVQNDANRKSTRRQYIRPNDKNSAFSTTVTQKLEINI